MKKRKLAFNELIDEIDAWMEYLKDSKESIKIKTINRGLVACKDNNDNQSDRIGFKTLSLPVDKKDYELLYKAAHKERMTISAYLKKNYFEPFKTKGADDYKKRNEFLKASLVGRAQAGAKRTIAMALTDNEYASFENTLLQNGLSNTDKRNVMRYFMNQFLVRAYALKTPDIDWITCKSSNIDAYAYDITKKQLYIMFKGSTIYVYNDVPKSIYAGLTKAASKGKYHNENITNKFEYERIK